jgi:hypothetical protein
MDNLSLDLDIALSTSKLLIINKGIVGESLGTGEKLDLLSVTKEAWKVLFKSIALSVSHVIVLPAVSVKGGIEKLFFNFLLAYA